MPFGTQNFLSASLRNQLFSVQKTAQQIAAAQLRLSTGRKVNSALDNPQNFFTARTLDNRRNDLMRLLDDMSQNIQVIKQADSGVRAMLKQLDLMDSYADETRQDLFSGNDSTLSDVILADDPDAYWKLNDTSSGTAENLGTGGAAINGTYINNPGNATELDYITGDTPAEFNGTNQYVRIPDSTLINTATTSARTVELVFEADSDITSRQVLYEEGGTVNAFAMYIENGKIYFNGRDQGDWGPVDISTEIEAGKTYHASFVFDGANQTFSGYLNGELVGTEDTATATFPSHNNDIGIGAMRQNSYFHDGPGSGTTYFFKGNISDAALYNKVISQSGLQARYDATRLAESLYHENAMTALMTQFDSFSNDAQYRGRNLLRGETLRTDFNERRSSYLETEGQNFTTSGLGFDTPRFRNESQLNDFKSQIDDARETLRTFGDSLAGDLSIIQTREDFTNKTINTLAEGADKLTLADQNQEGAEMLALQVRQQIQFTALALAGRSQFSVLRLVAGL